MTSTLSDPIAEGRTAEIYTWDEGHILKLYRDWCPRDWVEYEARIARGVYDAGIPSPAAGEIVDMNGRRGLVYERIEGISMIQALTARPWTFWKHARSLAELQLKIHQQKVTGLPTYKERLQHDIRNASLLKEEIRQKLLAALKALPDGTSLCHGDYHPGNVLITKHGPMVIDWMTACSGNRWADVARSSLLLGIGAKAAGKQLHPVLRLLVRTFHRTYLKRYQSFEPDIHGELDRWGTIIAAARLSEDITPERQALIKMVEGG